MANYYQPEIETASREQILAWQNERLVKQVQHVWDNVPYYRAKMEEKGLTRDATLFALQYLLSEYKEDIKPGTYEVSTAMTAEEIMAAMVPEQTTEETK